LADFEYFVGANRFPFQPRPESFSAVNAWWLAEASFLVYGDADFIEQKLASSPLPQLGFTLQWIGDRDNNRGIVLSSGEVMAVVFRGTRMRQHNVLDKAEVTVIDQDDLWTDSKFLQTACAAGGKVHRGFLRAYQEISEQLDEIVLPRSSAQALWCAGHSLGGALAVIAATHFSDSQIQGVCTFGAPRVGNEAFARMLPDRLHDRFVHRDDWVPTVPPEMIGYHHGGTLRPVPGSQPRSFFADVASGAQSLVRAAKSVAREFHIDFGDLPLKIGGFADHAPVYYATLLWNALLEQSATDS
jgi:hypothetical protein